MDGLPGYDAWKTTEPSWNNPDEMDEDEGLLILTGALSYLMPAGMADAEEQNNGDFEACCILEMAMELVREEYLCRFCGRQMARKGYCSRSCARADAEGL